MDSTLAAARAGWRRDATLIGLVGIAHGFSHFSQLLLAPLFPWLKDAFDVGYAQLGFVMTVFFTVSCVVQALSGFWVDRFGPKPVLFTGLALLGTAALGYALSPNYATLLLCAALAGTGNGVFHPVDYTLLNRKVDKARLGHAYSAHGITGSLGWALAPALLVPLTLAFSWRLALMCASGLAFAVLLLLWLRRDELELPPLPAAAAATAANGDAKPEGSLDFMKNPTVWMCFGFFFLYAGVLSVVQSFAPQAAHELHAVPAAMVAACLTIYMVCAAGGMVAGGFLATQAERCERVVALALGAAAVVALTVALAPVPAGAVPLLFGLMGLASGISGPSRDLLVKRSTPANATGRVYGVVYGGLDIGQALVPIFIGVLMDHGAWRGVWLALAALQLALVASAFRVGRVAQAQAEARVAGAAA